MLGTKGQISSYISSIEAHVQTTLLWIGSEMDCIVLWSMSAQVPSIIRDKQGCTIKNNEIHVNISKFLLFTPVDVIHKIICNKNCCIKFKKNAKFSLLLSDFWTPLYVKCNMSFGGTSYVAPKIHSWRRILTHSRGIHYAQKP